MPTEPTISVDYKPGSVEEWMAEYDRLNPGSRTFANGDYVITSARYGNVRIYSKATDKPVLEILGIGHRHQEIKVLGYDIPITAETMLIARTIAEEAEEKGARAAAEEVAVRFDYTNLGDFVQKAQRGQLHGGAAAALDAPEAHPGNVVSEGLNAAASRVEGPCATEKRSIVVDAARNSGKGHSKA